MSERTETVLQPFEGPAMLTLAEDRPAPSASAVLGGRYTIRGMLGGGGMGNVYLARDQELDEDIAVKVLTPRFADRPGYLDLLRREVKLARRVTHPNVLRTYDIGEHAGSRFITMELAVGHTLKDVTLDNGCRGSAEGGTRYPGRTALPLTETARIALAIC